MTFRVRWYTSSLEYPVGGSDLERGSLQSPQSAVAITAPFGKDVIGKNKRLVDLQSSPRITPQCRTTWVVRSVDTCSPSVSSEWSARSVPDSDPVQCYGWQASEVAAGPSRTRLSGNSDKRCHQSNTVWGPISQPATNLSLFRDGHLLSCSVCPLLGCFCCSYYRLAVNIP